LYVKDMSIEETAIEDVVRKIYREGNVNL